MFKRFSRILCLSVLFTVGLSATPVYAAPQLTESGLRAERYGSLYIIGESVKFIAPNPFPEVLQSITGTVYSADGCQIDEKTVDAADFKANGWKWLPFSPGFYEVEFSGCTADGKSVGFQEQHSIKIKDERETFIRHRYSVGVVPRPLPMK